MEESTSSIEGTKKNRIHRVVGRESDGVTRQQAEDMIATLRTRAREERLDLPKGRKIAMAFKEAADGYIKRLKEEGGKTIDRKERMLELYLTPALGNKPLSKITSSDLAVYRAQRKKLHTGMNTTHSANIKSLFFSMLMVPGDGVEPPTLRFSVACSTN
jgi:hypothetical protein